MSRRKTQFDESAALNNITWKNYFDMLVNIAMSSIEWNGLPEADSTKELIGVDERFLELTLLTNGSALYFKDEVLGELCLPCTIGGKLNVYQIPVIRRAYATNGYNNILNENNSVIIYNNMTHQNGVVQLEVFAKRLYNLDRIIDVNANAQKTPVLIKCDEKERLSLKNLYKEFDGNAPFIFGDKGLNPSSCFTVLKTDAPYICDRIYELKTHIWNEALTYLGVANTNVTKKERLIKDEVQRGLGGVLANRYSRLSERERACKAINKMFGTNISVRYRDEIEEEVTETFMTLK